MMMKHGRLPHETWGWRLSYPKMVISKGVCGGGYRQTSGLNRPKSGFVYRTMGTMVTTLFLLVVWKINFIFPYIGLLSSSQLTNSYFSEGWPNHQPVTDCWESISRFNQPEFGFSSKWDVTTSHVEI